MSQQQQADNNNTSGRFKLQGPSNFPVYRFRVELVLEKMCLLPYVQGKIPKPVDPFNEPPPVAPISPIKPVAGADEQEIQRYRQDMEDYSKQCELYPVERRIHQQRVTEYNKWCAHDGTAKSIMIEHMGLAYALSLRNMATSQKMWEAIQLKFEFPGFLAAQNLMSQLRLLRLQDPIVEKEVEFYITVFENIAIDLERLNPETYSQCDICQLFIDGVAQCDKLHQWAVDITQRTQNDPAPCNLNVLIRSLREECYIGLGASNGM